MKRRNQALALLAVLAAVALIPVTGSRYLVNLATEILIYVLFALSLNVLVGYAGKVSFGHAAYFAIGGYACAILLTLLHLGIKDIRLGPSLPAFITPNVLKVLVDNFNIMPISTPEEDLKAILG